MKFVQEIKNFFWKRLKKVINKFRQKFAPLPVSEVLDPLVCRTATAFNHASSATWKWNRLRSFTEQLLYIVALVKVGNGWMSRHCQSLNYRIFSSTNTLPS